MQTELDFKFLPMEKRRRREEERKEATEARSSTRGERANFLVGRKDASGCCLGGMREAKVGGRRARRALLYLAKASLDPGAAARRRMGRERTNPHGNYGTIQEDGDPVVVFSLPFTLELATRSYTIHDFFFGGAAFRSGANPGRSDGMGWGCGVADKMEGARHQLQVAAAQKRWDKLILIRN